MKSADDLKSSLKPEFAATSLNLASKSISDWGQWNEAAGFPAGGSWQDKLLYIDNALQKALAPLEHRPNERMFWRTRPDLNKHRGWLLNKVLQHQLAVQNGTPHDDFILPEDLPKLAADLYLFHKHHKAIGKKRGGDAGTLQHYKSLSALSEAVRPYQAAYPLGVGNRQSAHETFIKEYGGNGEAVLVAALNDGTEVIQVLSEAASRAYGSPRWCTAYREQETYFESYKDDLLVVMDPDGQRWQFHFRTQQFRDENDLSIGKLSEFLTDRDDLAAVLAPYWENGIHNLLRREKEAGYFSVYSIRDLLKFALSVPAFKRYALQQDGFLERFFKDLDTVWKEDAFEVLVGIAQPLSGDGDFQQFLIPYLFGETFEAMHQGTDQGGAKIDRSYMRYYDLVMSCPAWKEKALSLGIHEKAFPLLDNTINSYDPRTGKSGSADDPSFIHFCIYRIMAVPAWKKYAQEKGYFKKAVEDGQLAREFDENEEHARNNKFFGHTSRRYITEFWSAVLSIPEWKKYALEQNRLGRMLDVLFTGAPEDKSKGLTGSWKRNEGNYPAKTFMFMLPLFYNRPGFRESITPYICPALEKAKEDSASFKARGRGRRPSVKISEEILKYARNVSEWRGQATAFVGRKIGVRPARRAAPEPQLW